MRDFLEKLRVYDWTRLKKLIKFYLIVVFVIIIIILLLTTVIIVQIDFNTQMLGFLYTILNAFTWYIYINTLGLFNKGIRRFSWKLVILVIALIIVLCGFGYFNIRIHIRIAILRYQTFSTSSVDGIYFFWQNLYLWWIIKFITLLIESESTIMDV